MVSLAMILHDHGSLCKILARSCQDLGKHTHASWQACQDSCHWDVINTGTWYYDSTRKHLRNWIRFQGQASEFSEVYIVTYCKKLDIEGG